MAIYVLNSLGWSGFCFFAGYVITGIWPWGRS